MKKGQAANPIEMSVRLHLDLLREGVADILLDGVRGEA
jgi:hypothetical protein